MRCFCCFLHKHSYIVYYIKLFRGGMFNGANIKALFACAILSVWPMSCLSDGEGAVQTLEHSADQSDRVMNDASRHDCKRAKMVLAAKISGIALCVCAGVFGVVAVFVSGGVFIACLLSCITSGLLGVLCLVLIKVLVKPNSIQMQAMQNTVVQVAEQAEVLRSVANMPSEASVRALSAWEELAKPENRKKLLGALESSLWFGKYGVYWRQSGYIDVLKDDDLSFLSKSFFPLLAKQDVSGVELRKTAEQIAQKTGLSMLGMLVAIPNVTIPFLVKHLRVMSDEDISKCCRSDSEAPRVVKQMLELRDELLPLLITAERHVTVRDTCQNLDGMKDGRVSILNRALGVGDIDVAHMILDDVQQANQSFGVFDDISYGLFCLGVVLKRGCLNEADVLSIAERLLPCHRWGELGRLGNTFLMFVSSIGYVGVVEFLRGHEDVWRKEVCKQAPWGDTALIMAMEKVKRSCAETRLDYINSCHTLIHIIELLYHDEKDVNKKKVDELRGAIKSVIHTDAFKKIIASDQGLVDSFGKLATVLDI